jgi:predicted CopG family antitoxin
MVKVISLSDAAYSALSTIKEDYSFSELILKLLKEREEEENQKEILKFAGIWKRHSKEWDEIKEQIYEDRKRSRKTWQL